MFACFHLGRAAALRVTLKAGDKVDEADASSTAG
jgi:hypothetical protein